MTFSKSWGCGLIGLGLLAASGAQAAGFYIGGGVGASQFDGADDLAFVEDARTEVSVSDDGFGYSLLAGFELNNYISFEAAYTDYGEFKLKSEMVDSIANEVVTVKETGSMIAASASVKFSFPVKQKTDVYGKIGMAMWELEFEMDEKLFRDGVFVPDDSSTDSETFDDVAVTASFGTSYHYSANGSVYMEYTYLDAGEAWGVDQPVQGIYVGFLYSFGGAKNNVRQERNLTACDEKYEEQIGGLICD